MTPERQSPSISQPTWSREFLALAASGLLGWTVEAWLCRYFWNHDVGIGGGPMLLCGPLLVTAGSLALLHMVWFLFLARSDVRGPRPLISRFAFRLVGVVVLVVTNWIGLGLWRAWFKSVEGSFGRYVPQSKIAVPGALHAIVWALTLLAIALVVYIIRDAAKRNQFKRRAVGA